MLIDVHSHFLTARSGRADWRAANDRRLEAGAAIGITTHVASILGSWGHLSPTYFPSPDDIEHANDEMAALVRDHRPLVQGYCVVNPNFEAHAVDEIGRRLDGGMIGVKLAASRRADDPLLDPIAATAAARGVPILHHVWQHRRREWPGQEASDAAELATLAGRHPRTRFILAHLGGGGEWTHTLRAVRDVANIWVDLSGSGIDGGMIECAVAAVGCPRLLWGTDLTMGTGLAKLRYLEHVIADPAEREAIRAGNASALFPPGSFT